MTKENKKSGPPNLPKCEHGRIAYTHTNCPECRERDEKIKALVHPLVDKWWEEKGQNISLYHIVLQSYRMGMRNEHLSEIEEKLTPCPHCEKPRGRDGSGGYVCPCPHCGDELPF